jgi:3-hydroxyacyl-[acyl-carrier-protein] dehydratase
MSDERTPPTGAGAGTKDGVVLDIEGIQRLLPHRPPFLLVDRVVAYEPGKRLVAWKNVTMNEPHFEGHFPGKPVMPGVLMLEALAQAAGLLALMELTPEQFKQKLTYLMSIDGARFRRPVVPGDRLELEVEVLKHKGAIWKQKGTARVDGQVAAEGEFMAMLADRPDGER